MQTTIPIMTPTTIGQGIGTHWQRAGGIVSAGRNGHHYDNQTRRSYETYDRVGQNAYDANLVQNRTTAAWLKTIRPERSERAKIVATENWTQRKSTLSS